MSFNFLTSQISINKTLKSGTAAASPSQNLSGKSPAADLFIAKLNQMLARNGINNVEASQKDGAKTSASKSTLSPSETEVDILTDSVKNELLKEISTTKGFEFLTKLKQYLMASGYDDFNSISIGENGLDAVRLMMDKAGFDNSKVAQIIDRLKSESDNGNVNLSALIDELLSIEPKEISASDADSAADITNSDLLDNESTESDAFSIEKKADKKNSDSENGDNSPAQILELSAIPFISSIMKSLGIPDNIAGSIISNSEVKGEGLNLNTLISELQSLQKTSFFTGISFQNDADVKSIKEMLNQLQPSSEKGGLKNSAVEKIDSANSIEEKELITLQDFVSTLQGLKKSAAQSDVNQTESAKLPENVSTITGLNQSSKNGFTLNGFTLIDAINSRESDQDISESELLIKQLIGDIKITDTASESAKKSEESQLTETEMRYRALKSSDPHNLLMNLLDNSQNKQVLDDKSLDNRLSLDSRLSESAKSDNKDIKELLSSLGIVLKEKSDNNSDNSITRQAAITTNQPHVEKADIEKNSEAINDIKELLSSLGIEIKENDNITPQTNKLNLKNSSDLFNEMSQKKIINIEEAEKELNNKIMSGISGSTSNDISGASGLASSSTTTPYDILTGSKMSSELVGAINGSNENLTSGRKNEQQNRTNSNDNDIDSLLSRSDKKQSINIFDSNSSSESSLFGQNDNRGTSLSAASSKSESSPLPSYVTNQVVRSLNRAITNGESEIRLQLRPAELGRIFMTIETIGDSLKVSVVTENQSAKDILTEHADELKSSLADNGINIGSFDVEMGSDFKQSMADSGQQFQNSSDSNSNSSRSNLGDKRSSSNLDSNEDSNVNILNNPDGNLHFVA